MTKTTINKLAITAALVYMTNLVCILIYAQLVIIEVITDGTFYERFLFPPFIAGLVVGNLLIYTFCNLRPNAKKLILANIGFIFISILHLVSIITLVLYAECGGSSC